MKGIRIFTIIISATFCLLCCTDGEMQIGRNWVDVHTRVVMIDTCTVEMSSVQIDSIQTSDGKYVFVGIRQSSDWGTMTACGYLPFLKTEDFSNDYANLEYKEDIRFDSLTLYMVQDSVFCGDTANPFTLSVYRLNEPIEGNDDDIIYKNHSFGHDSSPIGSKSFMPAPRRRRAVEIRLSDELGKEFIEHLKSDDECMTDEDLFKEYFNGLVMKSETGSKAILGLNGCQMRIYYRSVGYKESFDTLKFDIDTTLMFTNIEIDRTGTPLENLDQEEISSRNAQHKAYTSGLSGIYMKLSFPYLNNIRKLGDNCSVAAAVLRIYPYAGSYYKQNYSSIPPTLNIYESNENNISTGSAIMSGSSTLQSGSLTVDEHDPEKTYYTYDITDFIVDQLGKRGVDRRFLQVISADWGETLDELVVGDQNSDVKNVELELKVTYFNE